MYILRTHLLEDPEVSLYYKGIAREEGVPFALNTIVAFESADAMILNKQTAMELCKRLNQEKASLVQVGYSEFEVVTIDKKDYHNYHSHSNPKNGEQKYTNKGGELLTTSFSSCCTYSYIPLKLNQ